LLFARKTTVFVTDISLFAQLNAVYARYYTAHCPARSTIAVRALPLGALVEIETVAVK
jgi:2-iminobutanoate/2-iminopropanoate deaminase